MLINTVVECINEIVFIAICNFLLSNRVVSKLVGLILLAIIFISPVMHVHCSCGRHQTSFVMTLSMDRTGNDLTNKIKSSYCSVFHGDGRSRKHPSVSMRKPRLIQQRPWRCYIPNDALSKPVHLLSVTSRVSNLYHLILLKSRMPDVWSN